MNRRHVAALIVIAAVHAGNAGAVAATEGEGVTTLPARQVAVPADASPALQEAIRRAAAQPAPGHVPQSAEDWRALAAAIAPAAATHEAIRQMTAKYHVTVTEDRIDGVTVRILTPATVRATNRKRLVMHLHGGAYVLFGGEAGIDEAVLLAHHCGLRVVAVDYRMPPESPFPAALDDAVTVWKQLVRSTPARNIAVAGTSAGGGLTLALVMRLRALHLPLPGALFAGTPWADLTDSGDTIQTNDGLDAVLSGQNDVLLAAGKLYAGTEDVRAPLISPVNGDFRGFPPVVLVSGTRDMLLSDTVRVHRKLRDAGVTAELDVFEGLSHAGYLAVPDADESTAAFARVSRFFERHLGR